MNNFSGIVFLEDDNNPIVNPVTSDFQNERSFFACGNIYDSERYIIAYEGEITNLSTIYNEYELTTKQISNCELLMEMVIKEGLDFPKLLKGFFLIFVFDKESKKIYLYRDKFGSKTLYYIYQENFIAFSSSLVDLMKMNLIENRINKAIIPSYLYHHYIAAPNTIYEDVLKLRAGEVISAGKEGISKKLFSNLIDDYANSKRDKKISRDAYKSNVKDLIISSVKENMSEGEKIGCFLSSGIDSSLVSAVAQSLSSSPIETFTIGFHDAKENEAEHAKDIANHLGTNHHEYYMTDDEMLSYVKKIPHIYEEPYADSSQIATMCAFDQVKGKVDVILGGDGGDEFFYGYNMFEFIRKMQRVNLIFGPTRYIANLLGFSKIKRLPPRYKYLLQIDRDKRSRTQLYNGEILKVLELLVKEDTKDIRYLIEDTLPTKRWDEKLIMTHWYASLPDDLMVKVFKPSAQNHIISRFPLLNDDLIMYSHQIPLSYKYNKTNGKKAILKEIVMEYIPKNLIERPKRGFSVPLKSIIRERLWDAIMDFSSKIRIEEQNIFDYHKLKLFLQEYYDNKGSNFSNRVVFAYYIFQLWYDEVFLDGEYHVQK